MSQGLFLVGLLLAGTLAGVLAGACVVVMAARLLGY